MKGAMKGGLKQTAIFLVAASLAFAQATKSAPVSAVPASDGAAHGQASVQERVGVPGTINYVEGQAMLNGEPLGPNTAGYTIAQPNQTIQTEDGFVEILLTPGAFLRIGHNGEVVMHSLGLTNVHLQVVHGVGMIEVANLVKGATMRVDMNGVSTQVEGRGLYEFDANQQLVRVLDGKAKVFEAAKAKTIGKSDQIVLTDSTLKPHHFDKKVAESDPLYVWSKARSQAEAQANFAVAANVAAYGGWYGPGWYWDPYWAEYAFLPGAGFLYSPFGWGFYSPAFVYAAPIYRGYYGPWHDHRSYGPGYYHGFYGHGLYRPAPGVSASIHGYAGGFHGGFHGGGGRR